MSALIDRDYVNLPTTTRPMLLVVVDTEEEFDWTAFPDRSATGVSAMESVGLAQEICDQYDLKPCYVVDYPIVSQPQGFRELKRYHEEGRCEIGAHLHPWVSPPFDECLSVPNMYPGNLTPELEQEKLRILRDAIAAELGAPPTAYKAGRYGFGPNTAHILENLGFHTDLSFSPPVDHRASGGPDYSEEQSLPFWFGSRRQLLELPLTGSFVGVAGRHAKALYGLGQKLEFARVPGIFSRLNLVDRLLLSPEGFTAAELKRLTRVLYAGGQRIFSFAYHSPSLKPGCTEYVRNESELEVFLDRFRDYFDFFFGELNGIPATPEGVYAQLEQLK